MSVERWPQKFLFLFLFPFPFFSLLLFPFPFSYRFLSLLLFLFLSLFLFLYLFLFSIFSLSLSTSFSSFLCSSPCPSYSSFSFWCSFRNLNRIAYCFLMYVFSSPFHSFCDYLTCHFCDALHSNALKGRQGAVEKLDTLVLWDVLTFYCLQNDASSSSNAAILAVMEANCKDK